MRVELLIAPDCPNAQVARTVVLSCLSELGVAEPVDERVGRFRSPTVLVDGQDVMGASMDLVEGDACRLDLPTAERVLAAMRASLAGGADGS